MVQPAQAGIGPGNAFQKSGTGAPTGARYNFRDVRAVRSFVADRFGEETGAMTSMDLPKAPRQ
jgi:hypothetical protein